MTHFIIKGTADIHSLKELGLNILGNRFRKKAPVFYGLLLVLLIILIAGGYRLYTALYLLLVAFYTLRIFTSARRAYRINVQRAEETGRVTYEYEFTFNDDSFHYYVPTSGNSGDFKYADLTRLFETKTCLFLISKADQLFPIAKSDIPEGLLPDFAAFLREKGVKVPNKLVQK